jgi:transposase
MKRSEAFIGLDVHKETIAVAIADAGRNGEVRYWGTMPNTMHHLGQLVTKLAKKHSQLEFTYEAGPCGYDIYRHLKGKGFACQVIAPSHIPRRAGDRVKNDHRDAVTLARLARAGELTAIWVPDPVHEAMRDLVRARHAASKDLKQARQRIQSFLLKHAASTYEAKAWTGRHRLWLAGRRFPHECQQVAFQSYLNAMEQCLSRRSDLEEQIRGLVPTWSLGALVNELQALRGVALLVAVTLVSEVGDMRRFATAKHLMAFLGLTPGEHSSGASIRPRGITKAGNTAVRRILYEAAWSYRVTPRVGSHMHAYMPPNISQEVKDIAWKAQLRLCKRYKQLIAKGKKPQVAITAVARELVGFIWAIGQKVQPPAAAAPS